MDEVDDVALMVERAAALDLGKAALEACVRPHLQRPGRRMQERRGYDTTTAQLSAMVGGAAVAVQRVDGVRQTGRFPDTKSAVTPDLLEDA